MSQKNQSQRSVILFILLFIFFYCIIHILFFNQEDFQEYHSSNGSKSISGVFIQSEKLAIILQNDNKKNKLNFSYEPKHIEHETQVSIKKELIQSFIGSKINFDKKIDLKVRFLEDKKEYRGSYSRKTIELYNLLEVPEADILGVFIHEFGHYIDIRYLTKIIFFDSSNQFYNISWNSKNVLKPGMKINDFVSGYAMTNKYEDFAESFTYYILFNKDFETKAKKSPLLQAKYNFMNTYIFKNNEFKNTNFRTEDKMHSFFRGTTKLSYQLTDFIQYISDMK